MKGFCQDERYLYFLLEYIPGGELFTYLRNMQRLEPDEARYFARRDIICAIAIYLHSEFPITLHRLLRGISSFEDFIFFLSVSC